VILSLHNESHEIDPTTFNEKTIMTYIISAANPVKKIKINTLNNAKIKDLQRKLVALSFTLGNNSIEYGNTLDEIHELRNFDY